MIKVTNLSFSYTDIPVFDNTSFVIGENQKVGIVGPNGAGKSTLLKIILGREDVLSGTIDIIGQIAHVPQEVKRNPTIEAAKSVRDYVDANNVLGDFEIKKLLANLEAQNVSLDQIPAKLSGGQKTKIALARALLMEPDILMLDEPTNFMDIQGKKWVMNFLANYPKTVVLISHDLELLDKHIDKVLYLNTHSKKIEEYRGNYTKFLQLKKEKEDLLKRQVAVEQKHIDRMKKSLVRLMGNKSKKGVRQRVMMQRTIQRYEEKLPDGTIVKRKAKKKFTINPLGDLIAKAHQAGFEHVHIPETPISYTTAAGRDRASLVFHRISEPTPSLSQLWVGSFEVQAPSPMPAS